MTSREEAGAKGVIMVTDELEEGLKTGSWRSFLIVALETGFTFLFAGKMLAQYDSGGFNILKKKKKILKLAPWWDYSCIL